MGITTYCFILPLYGLGDQNGPSKVSWHAGAAYIVLRHFGTTWPQVLVDRDYYLALDMLTEWHEFDRLGITLWSPDNGLSLALLMESAAFAPFVFLGAVLSDVFIAGVQHSICVTLAAEFLLTIVYVGLASVLRDKLKFNVRKNRLPDVVRII